jgi:enamine deaminase RidA (YjgF/YER057c/UK114 family)
MATSVDDGGAGPHLHEAVWAEGGEAGRPARSAVGMASLPFNIAVEIEGVVEV